MPKKRGQHTDPHTLAAQEANAGDNVLRAVRDAEHAKRGNAMRYAFEATYGGDPARKLHEYWQKFHNDPTPLDDLPYHARGEDGRTEYASADLEDAKAFCKLRNTTETVIGGSVTLWTKIALH